MILLFLSLFVQSLIPKQYSQLVEKAIKSSKTKIPKELRQETKFPGIYENPNYRLRLLKTLSSAQTHDIKGFAYDEHNCAIIKRKSFSLTEGYAIVEPETQGIYLMNNIVAEDGNIIVYNSTKVNIFTIMTEFVLESSTDQSALDLNSLRIKRPKASLNIPFFWDNSRDRPKIKNIGDSDISFGAGCSLTLGVTTRCSFNNIWDVSISFQFIFEGKFGAELVIPDDCTIEFEGQELFSLKSPISGLGFSTKFLGLQISLGAFVNFVTEFTDIGINIPIGFDFFKGYMITATKYFEITPTSISDSKWEITTSSLPSDDSLNKAIRNLLDASFTATLQLRPYLSLEFIIGDISTSLEAGLKFPLVLTVNLDKEKCHFPYLYGNFEIPIKMYFAFTGIQAFDYEIIKGAEKEIGIYTIKLSPFCIGKSRSHEGGEEEEKKEIDDLLVMVEDIYEQRSNNSPQCLKKVHISKIGYQTSGLIYSPSTYFPTEENKMKMDRIFIIGKPPDNLEIAIRVYYFDENFKSFDYNNKEFRIKAADLKFNENNEVIMNIELDTNENDKNFMKVVIKKVPHIEQYGVPFSISNKTFVVSVPPNEDKMHSNMTSYGLYYVDENNIIRHDEETIVYSFLNLDAKSLFHTQGLAYIYSYDFIYNGEKKCRLLLDFYVKQEINNQEKKIIISEFITREFDKDYAILAKNDIYFEYEYRANEPLLYSGKLVFSDGSEKEIPEAKFIFNSWPTRLGSTNIKVDDILEIGIMYYSQNSLLVVESKHELPSLLLFLDVQDVYEEQDVNENINLTVDYSYTFGTELASQAFYKTMRIHVSEKYRNSKLYLMHIDFREDAEIAINAENIVTISKEQVYFDIKGKDVIEFTFSRNPLALPLFEFRVIYCEFDPETLFISPQGSVVNVGAEIPTLMLAPIYYGSMFFLTNDTTEYNSVIRYPCYGDSEKEYYVITFPPYVKQSTLIVKSCVSPIGELEPYVNVDLSSYQDIMNQLGNFYYYIKSDYANDVECEIGDKVIYGKKISTLFQFNYSTNDFDNLNNKLSDAHFSSLCYDDVNGIACEIKYPTPERTGFHLIEFPNRDGISITGRGFLRELIPVEAGKSFTYYKSYSEPIKFVREYYNDSDSSSSSSSLSSDSRSLSKFSIKIKIDDNRNSNIEGFLRTRTICLYDDDFIIPFSRKFIEKDFLSFLKILGISENIDYNYLINDENGCIIFDPKFIDNNNFNVAKQVCDIYQNEETGVIDNVDKSNMFFEKGGKDPQQRNKMIIILVVAIIIVVVVIVLIVVLCIVIRKRRAKRRNESSNEGEEI